MSDYRTILNLMTPGALYSRDMLCDLSNLDSMAVSRNLGLLKKNKLVTQHSDKQWERVDFEESSVSEAEIEALTETMETPDDEAKEARIKERHRAAVARLDFTKPTESDIDKAMITLKKRLQLTSKPIMPPEQFEKKISILQELGKFLDPTIETYLDDIASDLTRLNNLAWGGVNESA